MKVQCDVCEKAQATVLCCADEASLCAECDTRVHAANKLASKHQRVPLLYPASPQDLPHCDICQEKTGFFFCLEDRALLCRNCDFSIHSTNTLAANHKRFLVSGIRVALQVLSPNDSPESMQTCSPLQMSSPTTQASQISPSSTQVSQLSSPRSARTPKTPRMTPMSSNMIKPFAENPSLLGSVITEEPMSKASSSLSLSSQEHQQPQHVSPFTTQQLRLVSNSGVPPAKSITASTTTIPSSSFSQHSQLNGGRQLSDWGVCMNTTVNSQDGSKGEMSAGRSGGGGGGGMKRSSISEYLTEAIPGWRVDELLNLPDMDSIYNSPGSGVAKMDSSLFRDEEWLAECEVQGLGEAVVAEVPSLPSPPTASGVSRSTKLWGFGKSLKEPDLDLLLQCDDSLVVPDIGGVYSPTDLSPSSLPQKRRRGLSEFDGLLS